MSANASEEFSRIQSEIYHHGYDRGYEKALEDVYNKIDEGVCDICEYKGFECVKECSSQNYEMQTLLKWLEQQGTQYI